MCNRPLISRPMLHLLLSSKALIHPKMRLNSDRLEKKGLGKILYWMSSNISLIIHALFVTPMSKNLFQNQISMIPLAIASRWLPQRKRGNYSKLIEIAPSLILVRGYAKSPRHKLINLSQHWNFRDAMLIRHHVRLSKSCTHKINPFTNRIRTQSPLNWEAMILFRKKLKN
jgi:hypothetical protein